MSTSNAVPTLEPTTRLDKDLKDAARILSVDEARFLVDTYYQIQKFRQASGNQIRDLTKSEEPHAVIDWLSVNVRRVEDSIKSALDAYGDGHVPSRWAKSICGLGPILSAGLLANIDIQKAPTAGHIWSFAGLNPEQKWLGKDGAEKLVKKIVEGGSVEQYIPALAAAAKRSPENLRKLATTEGGSITRNSLVSALAKRPWNARLKVLAWKIGESFVKVSTNDKDFYGKLLMERKEYEWKRNLAGELSDQAKAKLEAFKIGKSTDAFKWYSGRVTREAAEASLAGKDLELVKEGEGVPMLPPGHIHARAKRWAVKLFLSAYQQVAWEALTGEKPPKPYILTQEGGHAHEITVPNWPMA